jgi:hypothetical protein
MTDNSEEAYEYIGTYPNSDARILLDAFEQRGVRFDVQVDAAQLKGMNPIQARFGGSLDKAQVSRSPCMLMI